MNTPVVLFWTIFALLLLTQAIMALTVVIGFRLMLKHTRAAREFMDITKSRMMISEKEVIHSAVRTEDAAKDTKQTAADVRRVAEDVKQTVEVVRQEVAELARKNNGNHVK